MKITLSTGRVIETKEGESILESLKHSGIFLTSSCGGKGVCGKCKIILQSGDVDSKSHLKLSSEEIQKGYALACMTTPLGDITVDIPKTLDPDGRGADRNGQVRGPSRSSSFNRRGCRPAFGADRAEASKTLA